MEKRDIENVITESLKPIGFKKKGNYWTLNNGIITKMVNLQKSQFSNRFYINYGFILNSLPLGNLTMHIFNGVGSQDIKTNEWIKNILDLDNNIPKEHRMSELMKILNVYIIEVFNKINSEDDIRTDLLNRDNLNDISLNVKQYLDMV